MAIHEAAGTLPSGKVVRAKDINRLLQVYNEPWNFVTYSKMSGKLGINPKYLWPNVNGIYGYRVQDVLDGKASFGSHLPFLTIFTIKRTVRPYILDLSLADEKTRPLVDQFSTNWFVKNKKANTNTRNIAIRELDEEDRAELKRIYRSAIPQFPNLFDAALSHHHVVKHGGINRVSPVSYLFKYMTNNAGHQSARSVVATTGIHGYLTGATPAAHINYECVFLFPTDLKVLKEFNNFKGMYNPTADEIKTKMNTIWS